jgi:hypothetical protein
VGATLGRASDVAENIRKLIHKSYRGSLIGENPGGFSILVICFSPDSAFMIGQTHRRRRNKSSAENSAIVTKKHRHSGISLP